MNRLLAGIAAVALAFGATERAASASADGLPSHYDQPVSVAHPHPATASMCWTYGPAWWGMGRYFSAQCYSGWGPFYVKAWCYNDDGVYRSTAVGTVAWATSGISEGYCPFGTHPWHRWVVLL